MRSLRSPTLVMPVVSSTEPRTQLPAERHQRFFETETVRSDLKSKSIRGSAFIVTSGGANLMLGIVSTSILARLLVPADFGLLGMVFALTAVAEQFKDIGLGRATVQKKELVHSEVSNLFWLNAAVGAGICLAIIALSGSIASFYHERRLTHIATVLSTTFLFSGLTIQHQALLNRRMRFLATGLIGTGSIIVGNVVAITLALKGYGYRSLVWREIVRALLTAAGTFIACPWVPSLPDVKKKVWHHMRFARDITLFNLVTFFTSSVDQILLGKLGGAGVLGIYRQAFGLVMMPVNQLAGAVHGVSEPAFSALQDDMSKYRRGFQKAVSALSLVTMPIAAGICMCARPIVLLLLGQRWSAAVDLVRVLAIAACIRPAISTIGFVMVTCGKTSRYLTLGVLDSIALIAAVSVGVKWGALGIAYGHVVATYVVFLPFVWWALKHTPVDINVWLRAVARPAVCTLLMTAILYVSSRTMVFRNSFVALLFLVPLGVAAYFGAMLLVPGGKAILSELLRDCRSALGTKRKLPQVAVA